MRFVNPFLWVVILGSACLAGCGSDEPADEAAGEDETTVVAEDNGGGEPKKAEADNKPEPFPIVVVKTSLGDVTLKLNREKAPLTVQNFLNYCASRHYEGTIFHQVVKDQLVLGGGYSSEFVEKRADNTVRNEADNGLNNVRGTISWPAAPIPSTVRTCQFFINLADNRISTSRPAIPPSRKNTVTACSAKWSPGWRSWSKSPNRISPTAKYRRPTANRKKSPTCRSGRS